MNDRTKEILLILQEECSEVSQAVSKCFRFGITGLKPGTRVTNMEHLESELGDLLCMIKLLQGEGLISQASLADAQARKMEKLKTWSTLC